MTEAHELRPSAPDAPMVTADQVEAAALWLVRLRERSPPTVTRAFQAWLAEHPSHPEAYRQAEAVFGALVAPVARTATIQQRRQGRSTFDLAPRRRVPGRPAAIAAGFAAAALVVVACRDLPTNLAADAWTARGARSVQTLSDGSTVTLNTDSAARFDLKGIDRRVWLDRGQAWFDVARNPDRPFLIEAGDARIRVLGTAFEIHRTGNDTLIGVRRGKVQVTAHGQTVALTPGQEATVDADSLVVETRTPGQIALWTDGRAGYARASLSEVVDDLGRYRKAPVLVINRRAGGRTLSAQFDLRDPDEAVRRAASAVGARTRTLPGGLILIY